MCKMCLHLHRIMETLNLESKEAQIYIDVLKVFMRLGIKSVTMDDIARQLGVSKKTLYQFVKDKNDLVEKCMSVDCTCMQSTIKDDILSQELNAIDESLEISSYVIEKLKDVHPSILYDLEKYYKEGLAAMNEFKHEFILEVISSNIQKGIKEGLFRKDINVEITSALWVNRMSVMFEPSTSGPLQKFPIEEVYQEMFMLHIRGLVTEKGLKYFESKQMQSKQSK